MKIPVFLLLLVFPSITKAEPFAYERLESWAQFERMSAPGGGLVQTGRTMKFFIDNRDGHGKAFYIDGNYREDGQVPDFVHYHYDFAAKELGLTLPLDDFNRLTYFTFDQKAFYAGVLHSYPIGTSTTQLLTAQLYPQDVGHETQIAHAMQILRDTLTIPDVPRSFLVTGEQQTVATVRDALASAGYPPVTFAQILHGSAYRALTEGEAVGYLRLPSTPPESLTDTDIAIVKSPIADLPSTAASLTETGQTLFSPLNLRARERHAPNARLADATQLLRRWANKPIRLRLTGEHYEITNSSDEAVRSAHRLRESRPLHALAWGTESRLLPYAEICRDSDCFEKISFEYGARVAGRGFLDHLFPSGQRGFAIPARWSRREVGRELIALFRAAATSYLPGAQRLTLHASAHPEDVSGWEGPGRYESVNVDLGSSDEGLAQAFRLLYAQAENPALVSDRAWQRIDPVSVALGVAVEPADPSSLTHIATRIPNVGDVFGYAWFGEEAEGIATFARLWEPIGVTVLQPGPIPVIPPLVEAARAIELAYCQARHADYYPEGPCEDVLVNPRKPHALVIDFVGTASSRVRDLWELK